jgi:hypothetical protein
MIRRRNDARRLVGDRPFRLGEKGWTFLEFPVTKLSVLVEEVKPPVEPFLGLDPSGPSPVPGGFNEVKLSVVADRVVVTEKPPLLDREDPFEFEILGEGAMKILGVFRFSLETAVVSGEVTSEKAVGLLLGPDVFKTHLFDQPVLENAKEPLDPSLGLGRVGVNHSDTEFFQGSLKLALGFSLALQLFFQTRPGRRPIGRVFIKVDRLREAVAERVTPETVHGGKGAFVVVEAGKDGVGRIIDVTHQHRLGASSLQPIVVGAIHLDHFSKTGFSFSPLAVNPSFFLFLPETGFEEPLSQGLAIHPDSVSLEKFLLGERGAETSVTGPAEPEGLLLERIGMLSVGGLSTEFVDNSPGPLFPEPLHEALDLPQGKLQVFRCLALFESFLRDLLNDMQSFELSCAHRNDPLFFHPDLLLGSGC